MTAFASPMRSSAPRARAVRSTPASNAAMRDLLRTPAYSTPASAAVVARASAGCACGGTCPRCNSQPDAQPAAPLQTSAPAASDTIQRAGDPAEIPKNLPCPTDDAPGTPPGTDLLFAVEHSAITPAHTDQLTAFRATWVAAGGTGDILVHGYASTDGPPAHNWMLSCNRTQAVQAELVRLGIPAVHISIVAHGPSTDFGSGAAANRHAIVSTSPASATSPSAFGTLTPRDDFAGRSTTRFGAGEIINLGFRSFPARPATDFGGLQWSKATGGGEVTEATKAGDATYCPYHRRHRAAGASRRLGSDRRPDCFHPHDYDRHPRWRQLDGSGWDGAEFLVASRNHRGGHMGSGFSGRRVRPTHARIFQGC
jgi:outer membrane protein OmpA-like peptidoglycan-associated protein